jgi:hypothetical protein
MSSYFDEKGLFSSPQVSQYGNHMVMTNVRKSSKSYFLNIDTKFADDFNNNRLNPSCANTYNMANYTITLPEKMNEVTGMMVRNVEIPQVFYNVSSALGNNIIKITSGGFTTVITIPDGNYTNTTLVNALNALFLANKNANGGYLIYDISNNLSTIQTDASGGFILDFAVSPDGTFDKYNFKSKLGWILGFRQLTYTIPPSSRIYSESFVNLLGPKYLYLTIDEFSKGNNSSFSGVLPSSLIRKNIIAKLCLNQQLYPFGSILPANNHNGFLLSDLRTYNGKIDIQKLNVQLVDENGNTVNMNGCDFSFCLELTHE